MITAESATGPTTELLQSLIRNRCVNDGSPDSGEEVRNADLLQTYLEGGGLDVERFDSRPGRTSIVARIEGSDPEAPALCLMGHTDVVPVNPDSWTRDPFGGELVDGEVWGAAPSTCCASRRRWPSPSAGWPTRASGRGARSSTSASPTRKPAVIGAPST